MKSNKDGAMKTEQTGNRQGCCCCKGYPMDFTGQTSIPSQPSMAKLSIVVQRALCLFSGYCAFGMITSWSARASGGGGRKQHRNYSANCAGASNVGLGAAQGKCAGKCEI